MPARTPWEDEADDWRFEIPAERPVAGTPGSAQEPPPGTASEPDAVAEADEPSVAEAVAEADEPPAAEAVPEPDEPPAAEAVSEADEPSATEAVPEAVEPPAAEAVSEAAEPSATEAVHEAVEPPAAEAVSEAAEPSATEAVEPPAAEAVSPPGLPVPVSSMSSMTLPERSRHDRVRRRTMRLRRSATRTPMLVTAMELPEDAAGRIEVIVVRAPADEEEASGTEPGAADAPVDARAPVAFPIGSVAALGAQGRRNAPDLMTTASGWAAVGLLAAILVIVFVAVDLLLR
jgi:hypothetical protein